jgi:hypothetical protein
MAEESAAGPASRHSEQEQFGVLEIARYRKDDGRSLILYSHAEDAEDADAADRPPAPASSEEGEGA